MMYSRPRRVSRLLLAIIAAAILGLAVASVLPPSGPRTLSAFDPASVADLELQMWQAYYSGQRFRLFGLLVTLLREQYHYSWAMAAEEGFYLGRAAMTFRDERDHYERVLPDLEHGYATARTWLDAGFDPRAVARAELAWWVARRTPGQNDPQQVGELMADEYALLYGAPRALVLEAATLRAEAGALRDSTADRPDWDTVGRLLRTSYQRLRAALSTTTG
jgi:hypothetical protein